MEDTEYTRMRLAEDVHWWYQGLHALVAQELAAHGLPPRARVLDAGCGTGGTLAHLALDPPPVGVDLSERALALARSRHAAHLARAALPALPFAPASFDVALCLDVLYHRAVADPGAALRALHDTLRPGGLLVVNVPAYPWLRSAHDTAIHTGRRFRLGEVRELLAGAGFAVLRLTHWNSLLLPVLVPVRLARRGGAHSDLEKPPGPLEQYVGRGALGLERRLLDRLPGLPAGLSILAVGRRMTGARPPA